MGLSPDSGPDSRVSGRHPGPRVVYADDLGGLILLVDVAIDAVPDIEAVERAAATAPWMPPTLDALTTGGSLRAGLAAFCLERPRWVG